jgi:hypothetical protein
LELFSLEEEAAQLPGGLFVFAKSIFLNRNYGSDLLDRVNFRLIRTRAREPSRILCVLSVEAFVDELSESTGEAFMFCDGCGNAVQAGQAFCSKCGKQIVGPVIALRPVQGRVQTHTHLLGILWLAMSALNAVGGVVLVLLGTTFFPHLREFAGKDADQVPVGFLTILLTTLGVIVLAKAAAGFITGRGLMQYESWARAAALVLAFISLFNIPFGTAIGVYTMWVLMPGNSQQEYDALSEAKAA